MLEEYTVRRLAVASDRLPVLAGFAKTLAGLSASGDDYLAGLWKGQLVDDLMWQSDVQRMDPGVRISLDLYREPGWSWTSVLDHDEGILKAASFITNPQHIRARLGGGDENIASLVRHKVSLRVLSGEVTLRAQVAAIPGNLETHEDKGRRQSSLKA